MVEKSRYKAKRSKSTGVILAVFFGNFGWLYTYRYDAWKFWLNLCLAVVTLGIWGIVAWIWAIIDQSLKPTELYEDYYLDQK